MENIGVKKASFTVEAAFVMTITVWVLFSICYVSLYAHDRTVIGSMTHQYIEMETEKGEKRGMAESAANLKKQLQSRLFITEIQSVRTKNEFWAWEAEVEFQITAHFPFVERLFTGEKGKKMVISHENISAPEYLWNTETVEKVVK